MILRRHHKGAFLYVLPIKASDAFSLKDAAQNFLKLAETPGCRVDEILKEAVRLDRQYHDSKSFRMAVVFDCVGTLAVELKKWLQGEASSVVFATGSEVSAEPQVVFLFTGQGCQYPEMGKGLFVSQPTFRSVLLSCDEVFRECLKSSVIDLLYQSKDGEQVHQTRFTQPSLFAIEYAIAQLWISFGIHPKALIGHSVGEFAAACLAGVFNLENGLKLIVERARLMDQLPPGGGMTVVMAAEEITLKMIQGYPEISIAAINGPQMTVIAGTLASLEKIHLNLESHNITFTRLQVSHAFHSPLMAPALDPFESFASKIPMSAPQISLVSNLTGTFANDHTYNSSYWRSHLREAVQFQKGIQNFSKSGDYLFLEVGPANVLNSMSRRILGPQSFKGFSTMQKGTPDETQLATVAAQLFAHGCPLNWSAFYGLREDVNPIMDCVDRDHDPWEQVNHISDQEIVLMLKKRSA